ncbi:MAG: hypothetical protein MUC63_08065 [Planctomycetes bacterium]|nr:hypothetical protein [Planctomycetota bacterium]
MPRRNEASCRAPFSGPPGPRKTARTVSEPAADRRGSIPVAFRTSGRDRSRSSRERSKPEACHSGAAAFHRA